MRCLQSSSRAFAALRGDGRLVTWGCPAAGGDSQAVQAQLVAVRCVQASGGAFAALRQDGTVVVWGDRDQGGETSQELREVTEPLASRI